MSAPMHRAAIAKTPAAALAEIGGAEAFGRIADPGVGAVLWRRKAPTGTQDWLDALPPAQLPQARMLLPPEAITTALSHAFDIAGASACASRAALCAELQRIACAFAAAAPVAGIARGAATMLSMRIEPVRDDACRRFHIDAVPLRLVCALRGRGAQYGAGAPGAAPDRIDEAPPGAVLLLRGKGWPAGAPNFLHRSPPIEGSGETRLLFVLDLPGGARR
jgi:hypothetical protein